MSKTVISDGCQSRVVATATSATLTRLLSALTAAAMVASSALSVVAL